MSNTISMLWNGELFPLRDFGNGNQEMAELEILLQRQIKKSEAGLSAQTLELFKKYTDCVTEYLTISNEQAFLTGYKLAAQLTAEALWDTGQAI